MQQVEKYSFVCVGETAVDGLSFSIVWEHLVKSVLLNHYWKWETFILLPSLISSDCVIYNSTCWVDTYCLVYVWNMCSFIPASERQTSRSWYFIYLTHFRKYPHNFSLLYLVFSATDENCFQYNNSLCGYLYLRY